MEIYWLWLSYLKGIGPATSRKLVNKFGSPRAVYQATLAQLQSTQGIRPGLIETLLSQRSLDTAKRVQEHMQRCQINLLTFDNPYFPPYMNRYSSLPAVLYYRGNLRAPMSCIGIVGSRRCTAYGKKVAAEAAAFLGQAGVTVVSGMAKGIDSYAHTACLRAGGYTIAFIANGVDICYPPEHHMLMEEIINNGAVISSYPPGTRPRQAYFPHRNKLLAAWVDKLLVVEAAGRSGALITARYAMEYKRKVLAVPNSIYSLESVGTNRLLLSGAEVYMELQQLIDNDGIGVKCTSTNDIDNQAWVTKQVKLHCATNPQEQAILDRLDQPQAIQNLLGICDGDLSVLLELLCQMELEGKVIISGQGVAPGVVPPHNGKQF